MYLSSVALILITSGSIQGSVGSIALVSYQACISVCHLGMAYRLASMIISICITSIVPVSYTVMVDVGWGICGSSVQGRLYFIPANMSCNSYYDQYSCMWIVAYIYWR